MKQLKKIALFIIPFMLASLAAPAPALAAANDGKAATMKLVKTQGTVGVLDAAQKPVAVRAGMKLYDGYNVGTSEKSYAWINLDNAKQVKLDAASNAVVKKSGKNLEIESQSGKLFFNVTEPLKDDESLNIKTSTMVAGIRGTSGWIELSDDPDADGASIFVLEGTVEVTASDPQTGLTRNASVTAGETVVVSPAESGQTGVVEIVKSSFNKEDLKGFVLQEVVADNQLAQKIFEKSGGAVDLRDVTPQQAAARLAVDQAETAKAVAAAGGLANINPVAAVVPQLAAPRASAQPRTATVQATVQTTPTPTPAPSQSTEPSPAPTPTPTPTPIMHTVTFDFNDGRSPQSLKVADGEKAEEPVGPTKEGYTFEGWYKEPQCATYWNFASDTVMKDATLYAKWMPKMYIVTFDFGEGTIKESEPIEYNSPIRPEVPESRPIGYEDDGWYRDIEYTQKWNFDSDKVTGNIILHAKLTPSGAEDSYSVIFDLGYDGKRYKQVIEEYGIVHEPKLPPRPGYELEGWYTEPGCENQWDFATTTVISDMILYANWTSYTENASVGAVQALSLEPTQEQSVEPHSDEKELAQPNPFPTATPQPAAAPAPTPKPTATPESTPKPTPEQTPESTPMPTPEQTPTPTPIPEQTEQPGQAGSPAEVPSGSTDNQNATSADEKPHKDVLSTEQPAPVPAL